MTVVEAVPKTTSTPSPEVEIWLYGSVARGTYSESSDLDVLVVSDSEPDPLMLKATVAALPQAEHLSVRRYSWCEVSRMAEYGSLFLLHVKLEGHLLFSSARAPGLVELLATLPDYRNDARDIRGFVQALDDSRWALDDAFDEDDVLFELGVIATVIRHCSILACYKLGAPQFQTADSIRLSFAAVGMAEVADAATDLYQFRLATARKIRPSAKATLTAANIWLSLGRSFVEKVGNL